MTRILRNLLIGLAALMFAASGVARAAPPPGQAPPCHQMNMRTDAAVRHGPSAPGKSRPDMMAMNCCQACLPVLAIAQPTGALIRRPASMAFIAPPERLEGRVLAPEPGPPRTV